MGKTLLTLDTLEPDRDFISVDGKAYSLRGDEELSLTQFARIRRLSTEVAAAGIADDASEEDMAKIENYINSILDVIVLGMQPDVRDKLTPKQKFQVVEAFTTAASLRRAEAKAESQPITEG